MSLSLSQLTHHFIFRKVTIAPLVTFRILFGLLMFGSTVRFWAKGWITDLYITPRFYFPFLEGVFPLPGNWMYVIFGLIAIFSLCIAVGFYYRWSALMFFSLFTYVEIIDKTNYLNHYYFISLVALIMIFLPANGDFSLDVRLGRKKLISQIPIGLINLLRLQLSFVYFFAGIAKINADWLLKAQPMKMWLSANAYKPVLGWIFQYKLTAYLFSWFGMIYDTTIPFLLSSKKILPYAYTAVIVFHFMTWYLFPIGMFPWIMMVITTIFFPVSFHERVLRKVKTAFAFQSPEPSQKYAPNTWVRVFFTVYLVLQVLMPYRYLLYPGNLFWTEEGYRFSWRVMLMEKAGSASFYVKDIGEDKAFLVPNYEYLTPQQEKMVATQPDMLVQYAHILEEVFRQKGMVDPVITAEVFVTLNGRQSKQFIDPTVDLTEQENTWSHKEWILDAK